MHLIFRKASFVPSKETQTFQWNKRYSGGRLIEFVKNCDADSPMAIVLDRTLTPIALVGMPICPRTDSSRYYPTLKAVPQQGDDPPLARYAVGCDGARSLMRR
jgi:hypothetical protein